MKRAGWLILIVLVLFVFLWHSSSLESFQDQVTDASGNKIMGPIRGPPYSAADATNIVGMMPDSMKTALQTSTGSTDAAKLIQPITDLMSDFHGSVYLPATSALKSSDVDTFLTTARVPPAVTSDDAKTLLVAYFVNQQHGDLNPELTSAQTTANAQQLANSVRTSNNASDYNDLLAAVGQTTAVLDVSGSPITPTLPSAPPPYVPPPPTNSYSSVGDPLGGNSRTPFGGDGPGRFGPREEKGTQVGGPRYGGVGTSHLAANSGSWPTGNTHYPDLVGPPPTTPNLPNSNASGVGMTLPTPCQVGSDGNTIYTAGCRAPTDLGWFGAPTAPKMDGDPSPFSEDYRVFMK